MFGLGLLDGLLHALLVWWLDWLWPWGALIALLVAGCLLVVLARMGSLVARAEEERWAQGERARVERVRAAWLAEHPGETPPWEDPREPNK